MNRLSLIITLLLSGLIAHSCVTQNACARKWPPSVIYHDTITYRDTTLYVFLPPDTVQRTDTVMIVNNKAVTLDTMVLETDYAIAWAWVANSRIYQRLAHKATALELRYDSLLREKVKVITVTNTIREKPKFSGVMWQVIVLVGIILLIILVRKFHS